MSVHIEQDAFYEVLVGPGAKSIFALHYVEAIRYPGNRTWDVIEHHWRVDGTWDGEPPEYEDHWRWRAEIERLAELPDLEERFESARRSLEEFTFAWDVSRSFRVHNEYVQACIELFDSPIDLPSGLANWLTFPPTQIIDPMELPSGSNPAYDVALKVLSRAAKHSRGWPPDGVMEPLWRFVNSREPQCAGEITRGIMRLLLWFHATDTVVRNNE